MDDEHSAELKEIGDPAIRDEYMGASVCAECHMESAKMAEISSFPCNGTSQ